MDGGVECVPTAFKADLCPCKASETTCLVTNYLQSGFPKDIKTQCIAKGGTCPCGVQAKLCVDTHAANKKFCIPKFTSTGANKCPAPCSTTEEAAGNRTCSVTDLDSQGNPTSQDQVSCKTSQDQ